MLVDFCEFSIILQYENMIHFDHYISLFGIKDGYSCPLIRSYIFLCLLRNCVPSCEVNRSCYLLLSQQLQGGLNLRCFWLLYFCLIFVCWFLSKCQVVDDGCQYFKSYPSCQWKVSSIELELGHKIHFLKKSMTNLWICSPCCTNEKYWFEREVKYLIYMLGSHFDILDCISYIKIEL